MRSIFRRAFTDTVPVMTGYLVLGIGFGILLKTAGYGAGWSAAMSAFIYAGSMQYAAIGLISSNASLLTVALTTLTVNARHVFYGISMIEKYKSTGKIKPYLIFSLTDETYSLVSKDIVDIPDDRQNLYYLLVSVFDHSYWVIGSVLGSVAGNIIPFNTEGIDFALTALFVTVFTDNWIKAEKHFPAVCGILVSAICLLIFGADSFLIPSMTGIAVVLLAGRRQYER